MALNYEMKNLIDAMTQEVIKIYNIQIPITDIDEVVRSMGGVIREDSGIDSFSDGRIRKSGSDSFVIEVSPFQTEERRNFTIAHELGHLFLHMGFQTNEQRWNEQANVPYYRNGNSELEYQSNEFAAAFLMPRYEFKRVMDEHTDGSMVNTAEIARYFHVSVSAAANRGKWLGYLKW
jgi:Zn-dependent peptidase ImmA (M78 family)